MPSQPPVAIQPNRYYHVFNRGVNRRTVFRDDADHLKFLSLLKKYLQPVGRLLSYALLRDHYHLTVLMHPAKGIPAKFLAKPYTLGRTFSHLQNAYANYFNARHGTVSGMFQRNFHRIEVDSLAYLRQLIIYHHFNPEKHGVEADFRDYLWTSYKELSHVDVESMIDKAFVFAKFGGKEAFFAAHRQGVPLNLDFVDIP